MIVSFVYLFIYLIQAPVALLAADRLFCDFHIHVAAMLCSLELQFPVKPYI
jgi:hypothetical protein